MPGIECLICSTLFGSMEAENHRFNEICFCVTAYQKKKKEILISCSDYESLNDEKFQNKTV